MVKESVSRVKVWTYLTLGASAAILAVAYMCQQPNEKEIAQSQEVEMSISNEALLEYSQQLVEKYTNELNKGELLQTEQVIESPTVEETQEPDVPEVQVPQYEVFAVKATGYTAGPESTGKGPGHPAYGKTASGVYVKRSHLSTIAADTRYFPFGTVIHIPGYGLGVVSDTGSAIKGMKLDLYFDTVAQVYSEWGSKSVEVQVIEWGTGKLNDAMYAQLEGEYANWQE